ncbi:hypothetical protein LDENG_00145320, partial [Lucifuga dentata]
KYSNDTPTLKIDVSPANSYTALLSHGHLGLYSLMDYLCQERFQVLTIDFNSIPE